MSDSRNPGDRGIHPPAQRGSPNLGKPPHQKPQAGDIQPHLIERHQPAGALVRKGEDLFGQHQRQEEEHPQQEVVGVQQGQVGLSGKVAELGKLPVKYPEYHRNDGIDQGQIGKAFSHNIHPPYFSAD